jgi:ribosome maturation protein SDO1
MSKSLVVKLKKGNTTFEVLTKVGSMEPYRDGKLSLDRVLEVEEIFKNASKFDKIKSSELKKAFGSDNKKECILKILEEGNYPLSKKELQAKVQARRGEILNYLHKYYHEPLKDGTSRAHPITRLDSVLREMKVNIDPHMSAYQQIRLIVKQLPEFLPIKPINPPHLESFENRANGGGDNGKSKRKNKGR